MLFAAPAAERSERNAQSDTQVSDLRVRPGVDMRSALPSFAQLLGSADDRVHPGPVGLWRNSASFHLYVPERIEPHAIAWRTQPGRRALFAEPIALSGMAADTSWRATLMPRPGTADRPAPVSGLAVVDGDGMLARYEFAWVRGPSGWQTDEPADRPTFGESKENPAGPTSLDPVASVVRGMWAESCGRCLRYLLGRKSGAPQLALCRRDCLSTFSAF